MIASTDYQTGSRTDGRITAETVAHPDYRAVYQALPAGVALLSPDLTIVDANRTYLRLAGRTLDQLLGHYIFEMFPDNPNDPHASGTRNLKASLRRVVATGQRDAMAVQRYDVERPDHPGEWEERYWSLVNAPIFGEDGKIALLLHRVEEISEFINVRAGVRGERASLLEAEIYARARELQEVNDRLRQAHAHERDVALVLQDAMQPRAPRLVGQHRAAVHYQPAVSALNVCGDWYDLVDLPHNRAAVAVGDVVGHGLRAACVMGQLRSALSAATRAAEGPAQALEALGLYARSIPGAESATVAAVVVDWARRSLAYSIAGHLPPALLHTDGSVSFLDRATDPPLAVRPDDVPRPQAETTFTDGDTLALYTDGLVERRREDIDISLARLTASLIRHRDADPDTIADGLLADLVPSGGATDDIALVVLRL